MAKLYGWGASVVILGALFKIMHYPGAGVMLLAGMGTEAIIFYDQEDKEGVPCVAMGITLDEEVYNDHMKAAKEAKDCTEYKGGVMYTEEGHMRYLCRIGDKAYFSIFAEKANQKQMKAFVDRFNVTPAN